MSLKELTSEQHRAAEQTRFMQALIKKELPPEVWTNFIYQKWIIYKLIEGLGGAYCGLNKVLGIFRAFLLYRDFKELAPIGKFEMAPSTDAYYRYLLNLGNQPEKIWAHIYVWHMGDLYGGQMIKRLVPGSSSALEFENKDELILFIRNHCTTDMADEAKLAFEYAIKIMNDLF